MSDKHLTELPWKTLVTKQGVKDLGLGKAFVSYSNIDATKEPTKALDALKEVSELAIKLKKANAAKEALVDYLDEVVKEIKKTTPILEVRVKSVEAAAAKAKGKAEAEEAEEEDDEEAEKDEKQRKVDSQPALRETHPQGRPPHGSPEVPRLYHQLPPAQDHARLYRTGRPPLPSQGGLSMGHRGDQEGRPTSGISRRMPFRDLSNRLGAFFRPGSRLHRLLFDFGSRKFRRLGRSR